MIIPAQGVGWLVCLVILVIIEALTMGLTTIWFAGGALAAFITVLLDGSFQTQMIVFCAVSVVLLLFTRPAAMRLVKGRQVPTNADRYVGESGIVTEEIDNLTSRGKVQVKGLEWTARSEENGVIPEGRQITVCKIDGVKLIVKEVI